MLGAQNLLISQLRVRILSPALPHFPQTPAPSNHPAVLNQIQYSETFVTWWLFFEKNYTYKYQV